MRKLDILGIEFIIVSIVLGVILYKLEISKHIIDEDYEYIKKHRIFGNLTKYLTIISIISIVLIDLRFIIYKDYEFIMTYGGGWVVMGLLTICTGFFQKKNSVYFKRGLIAILYICMHFVMYFFSSKSKIENY